MTSLNLDKWLRHGGALKTSGTTGEPKNIYQSVHKLKAGNAAAIDSQEMTSSSRIYTICKTQHAGGLLAQTLPAYSIGADITVEDFNTFRFAKEIHKYTHTHITPGHAKIIMLTKGFVDLDLTGIWVTCGSDKITWDIIEAFVERGATFMTNWGMTEVGPTAINTVFRSMESVQYFKDMAPAGSTLLGNRTYCNAIIANDELIVDGDIVLTPWMNTGDDVTCINGVYYYFGRI